MPRKRNVIPDDVDPDEPIQVTVRFKAEVVRELDLRAIALDCDRADIIRMETLKGIGWVDRKRAEQERDRVDREARSASEAAERRRPGARRP